LSRLIVVADIPAALSPRMAASAIGKSFVLIPFRYSVARAPSSVGVRL
jgi:hypothetical protein